jgi:CubicO group peptidase (beta-lactamase class C family)
MRSLATLLLFLSLFSARSARAQAPTYNFTPLTQLLQDSLARLGGRAGLLLIQNGQVIYKQYFGGWNDNTTIPIASGSKLPSMAAVLTLVDEGRLNLDDVVTKYLPQSFAAKPAITLRQLMSHTSGLPGGSRFLETNTLTLAQAVDSIGRRAPMSRYAPGTAFQYGGVSMHVAGRLAEIAAGESWDALFARRIAGPLNMPNTDYLGLGPTTNFRIAGGAQTRMPEYAHLLQMLLDDGLYNGQRVLSPAAVRAMLSDQTAGVPLVGTPYQNDPRRQNFRYGFGAGSNALTPTTACPPSLAIRVPSASAPG